MVEDDVLREVRAAREAYARLHHFDVRAMVEDLRRRDTAGDRPVLRHAPRRPQSVAVPAVLPNQVQQTGKANEVDTCHADGLPKDK